MSKNRNIQVILFSFIVIVALVYVIFIKPNYYRFNGGQIYFDPTYTKSFVSKDSYEVYAFGDYIYISSSNGMKKLTDEGEIIWDKSFYVENPKLYAKGEYMAVVDITNKNAYIFNSEGILVPIKVNYPIIMADINENGAIVLVQEDNDHHYIELYNREGTFVAERGTTFNNVGYPIDIALSPSGNKIVTSYVSLNNDIIESEVSFFSFEDVGENQPENIIGGATLQNTLASEVKYIDENHAVVIGDNQLKFYLVDEKLTLENEIIVNNKIMEYSINDNSVILLYGKMIDATHQDAENTIVVYNKTGEQISSQVREETVNYIKGDGKSYYLLTSEGVEKYTNNRLIWQSTLQREVKDIIELGQSTYILVYAQGYEIVRIKEI